MISATPPIGKIPNTISSAVKNNKNEEKSDAENTC